MKHVTSADGTQIACECSGAGPAMILVDGALCSRPIGSARKLASHLARHFTVYVYDRRGRGDSGDTQPYAIRREVEDIEALIREAGGSAFLVGLSSGGALALEAAASGLDLAGLAVYEPPYMIDDAAYHREADHESRLREMLAAGQPGNAVKYFITRMVGMPGILVLVMRLIPGFWSKLEKLARTLPYDAAIMGDWSLPRAKLATITTRTLAIAGEKTDRRLRRAAQALADALPNASLRALQGQSHNVKPAVLAAALVDFFTRESQTCAA